MNAYLGLLSLMMLTTTLLWIYYEWMWNSRRLE